MRDVRSFRALSVAAVLLAVAARASAADAIEAIARGDAAWEHRADGAQGGHAAKGPIGTSVAAYEEALKADPGNLEARWKLLRSIWFQGEYATANNDERQKVFARGKEVSEAAWVQVGKRVGAQKLASEKASDRAAALRGVPEAAPLLLFSAANWGLWADAYGKLAAARQGVAVKVRDWAETLIVLDGSYDDGAGHRVLGRVHTEAPHIPFVTGWVDHDKGIAELEKSVALGPGEPGNRYYLARAILDFRQEKKARALALLREAANAKPRPDFPVEDAKSSAQAAELLAKNGR